MDRERCFTYLRRFLLAAPHVPSLKSRRGCLLAMSKKRRKSPSSRSGRARGRSSGRRSSKRRRVRPLRFLFKLSFAAALLAAGVFVAGSIFYHFKALDFDLDEVREVPERTLVYDKGGALLGHVSGHGENRLVVPVSEVSPHFVEAILAREDSRFYHHGGVDYLGVARAVVRNFKAGSLDQGASTLTMQLARNTFEMREKTLNRKFLEAALARRIENRYSKDEILAFYMNRIYFGSGLYGIERAAQGFFMKPASKLSRGEAAMLAGVIRGPSLLNPFRSLENATATRDEVLARLLADRVITREQAEAAKAEPVVLRPPDQRFANGSYNLQTVFDLLTDFLDPLEVQYGGLRVHTTIDVKLQREAETALDAHLAQIESGAGYAHPPRRAHQKGGATRYLQGAVVTLDNRNGAIRAMVGGRSFAESPFNRAYQAQRQAGSTFKPFLYAVAMDRGGLLPGVYVSDDPVQVAAPGGQTWSPRNADGTFTGIQPAAVGLIRSRNTMSVRVGQIAGLGNVRGLASALKFGELPNSPVIYLGAFETTPYTMTSAYSTFPARGVNYTPYLIERISHRDGRVLFQHEPEGRRIFDEGVAWVTSDMLAKAIDEGTGAAARRAGYSAPAYGKTGTTNDYRDAWFVGYTDKLTTGVWVGLDQPKKIMDRGFGGTLALPVWTRVMQAAEQHGYAAAPIPPPAGTATTVLCRECGLLQGRGTRHPYQMDLPPDRRPRASCQGHRQGLFAGGDGTPRAFPVDEAARPLPGHPPARYEPEGGGVGRALRNVGRAIFGGRRD